MSRAETMPKALPLLDNIETTQNNKTSRKPLIDKASDDFFIEKKYDKNINSDAIIDITEAKNLSFRLAHSLIENNSFLIDKAEKMLNCGNYVEVAEGSVVYANFCRLRLCPMCQRRRSLRAFSDFCKMNDYLDSTYGYKFLHLVLTVPNCSSDELGSTISKLYKSFNLFLNNSLVKNKFKGVARCLEVSYNNRYKIDGEDGEMLGRCFHPHLHCLVAVSRSYGSGKNYIRQELIQQLWTDINGSSQPLQVHIERIKDGDTSALAEVAKYSFKPLEFTCSDAERVRVLEALNLGLHGRRLVTFFGVFKEAKRITKAKCDEDNFEPERIEVDGSSLHRYNYNCLSHQYEAI